MIRRAWRRRLVASLVLSLAGFGAHSTLGRAMAQEQAPGAAGEPLEVPAAELPESTEPVVLDQFARLRRLAQEAVDDPESTPVARADAIGELGRHYHAYGFLEAARACYEASLELAPRDFRWPYFLGYLAQAEGRLEAAVKHYEKALAIVPGVSPTMVRMASALVELGNADRAEWLYREALRANPTSAAAHAGLGELLLADERPGEAIERLEAALTLASQANRLYYPLALAYRKLGNEEKARELLSWRGSVGVKPDDPVIDALDRLRTGERVHLLQGQSAFRVGRFAEAAESFRKALEANPESVAAWIDLGSALGESGDVEGAVAAFQRAVELAPGNETALYNLGVLLSRTGHYDRAIDYLSQAGQFAPADGQIRFELAQALRLAGRFQDSLIHFEAAIQAFPELEAPRLGKAQALTRLGEVGAARETLEAALGQIPGSVVLARALSRVLVASGDAQEGDAELAVQLALSAFEAGRGLDDAEWVAQALAAFSRCEEAASWQRRVVEEATESEQPQAVMARLQASLARYESDRCGAGAGLAQGG